MRRFTSASERFPRLVWKMGVLLSGNSSCLLAGDEEFTSSGYSCKALDLLMDIAEC